MDVELIEGKHIHGLNLRDHAQTPKKANKADFSTVVEAYEIYRNRIEAVQEINECSIREIVAALNDYRKSAVPIFDSLDNAGQQQLGSTIMEEFFYLFFKRKIALLSWQHKNLFLGKGNSYVSLSFTPQSFSALFANPKSAYIHTKNQDFIMGASVEINFNMQGNIDTKTAVIPVVAIECKTYIERNMLDSCAATASRLKNAMPYCVYIVAAEYMKMKDAYPELTDIDEVYILCKAKLTDRNIRIKQNKPPIDIDADLIMDLFHRVERHLNAIWWKPEDALKLGKIINRPT